MEELTVGTEVTCKRCGEVKPRSKVTAHLCSDCEHAENNRLQYFKKLQGNWMDIAKEQDIDLWERQPQETDREWQVWLTYRDSYPALLPSYKSVAEQCGTTVNVVRQCGSRWDYAARFQAWIKCVDDMTMRQRQKEIVEMNKQHIDMATSIRDKLKIAIGHIDPLSLKPNELGGLFKLVTEIERKARLEEPGIIRVAMGNDEDNPALKRSPTKTEDLTNILQVLAKAGVLQNGAVGVRQTTEVIIK